MSASTITVKQQSFVRTLLEDRLDVLGITDIDEYIRASAVSTLTGAAASKLIDYLKSIPTSRKPEHAHLPEGRVIANRYANKCQLCGGNVDAGTGWAVQTGDGWRTFHAAGACTGPAVESTPVCHVVSGRTYRTTDGTIAVAYTTQNGNLAARRLIIDEDGGHLEYWKGGVAVLRATGAPLSAEEAAAIGRTHSFCVSCCRDLSDDRSLAAGYGETCASNNGWAYPTRAEAAAILKREVK